MLIGVFTTAIVALCSSVSFYPLDARQVNLKAGEHVFNTRCASCHNLRSNSEASYGPALVGIGELAHKRVAGMSGEAYLLQSIARPEAFRAPGSSGTMPSNLVNQLSEEELLNVVAFLASQGGTVRYRELLQLPMQWKVEEEAKQVLTLESIERGRNLFFGKLQCTRCHLIDGNPESSLKAPTLAMIGNQSRRYLQEAITNPSAHISPAYVQSTIARDGKLLQGRRLPSKMHEVRLLVDQNDRWEIITLPRTELEPLNDEEALVLENKLSLMPVYEKNITPEETGSLIDFLSTFR
jgi:cytochrome c553